MGISWVIVSHVALLIASRWLNSLFLIAGAYFVLSPISTASDLPLVGIAKHGRVYVILLLLFVAIFLLRLYRLRAVAIAFLLYVGFYVFAGIWSDAPIAALKYKGLYGLAVLSGFYFITSVFSTFLSNNATAVLMTPIAFLVADTMGLDPRPFLVAIAYGASASFATPVGYQTNLIIMGPGGYTFGDYFRFGLPLNILMWAAATLLIPLFLPLR